MSPPPLKALISSRIRSAEYYTTIRCGGLAQEIRCQYLYDLVDVGDLIQFKVCNYYNLLGELIARSMIGVVEEDLLEDELDDEDDEETEELAA